MQTEGSFIGLAECDCGDAIFPKIAVPGNPADAGIAGDAKKLSLKSLCRVAARAG
jgi:hypothetical protein